MDAGATRLCVWCVVNCIAGRRPTHDGAAELPRSMPVFFFKFFFMPGS